MKINEMIQSPGQWLLGKGKDSDVILSSRIRLARNLNNIPFSTTATDKDLRIIQDLVTSNLAINKRTNKFKIFNLVKLNKSEIETLFERHLISRELVNNHAFRSVAIDDNESVSIMINEEDHIRMQIIKSGFYLKSAWKKLSAIDDSLSRNLEFAFSPEFGYLTSCLTNLGTAMRISVLMHLPSLTLTRQIERVSNALSKINFSVRGIFGEGSSASGNIFQVSNQSTMGITEEELINTMLTIIPEIVKYERAVRERLILEKKTQVKDRVFRALGIIENAEIINSEEAIELLSAVRFGIVSKLIKNMSISYINNLFSLVLPGHIQLANNTRMNSFQRDSARAQLLKNYLCKKNTKKDTKKDELKS